MELLILMSTLIVFITSSSAMRNLFNVFPYILDLYFIDNYHETVNFNT